MNKNWYNFISTGPKFEFCLLDLVTQIIFKVLESISSYKNDDNLLDKNLLSEY